MKRSALLTVGTMLIGLSLSARSHPAAYGQDEISPPLAERDIPAPIGEHEMPPPLSERDIPPPIAPRAADLDDDFARPPTRVEHPLPFPSSAPTPVVELPKRVEHPLPYPSSAPAPVVVVPQRARANAKAIPARERLYTCHWSRRPGGDFSLHCRFFRSRGGAAAAGK
ncbi:MAG: hypothetical protein H6707_15935 [Deltaproteobacteria bacterium]|nr:hypothetical protein [Deltaproteobacteria bacterium]